MTIYLSSLSLAETDRYAISIRRRGFDAYVETDGKQVLLITNYLVYSISFAHVGER